MAFLVLFLKWIQQINTESNFNICAQEVIQFKVMFTKTQRSSRCDQLKPITGQWIIKKTRHIDALDTWACDTVMWQWAVTLFLQLSIGRNIDVHNQVKPILYMPFGHLASNALQKRAHWKTSPVKSGVPIRLCEQKRSFKDYRRFWSLMNFIAVNYSHTFKRQCRNNRSRLPLF